MFHIFLNTHHTCYYTVFPGFNAVTIPFPSTIATEVSEDVHDIFAMNTPGLDFSFPIYESGNYRVILQPLYDTTLIMDNFKIWY